MHGAILQATAVLDHLLERDTGPAGGTNGAFGPGSVDELVAVTGVLVDLLKAASAGALESDYVGLARELRLVLQILESKTLGVVDETVDIEVELLEIDFGNTAMVAHEEVFVAGDLSRNKAVLDVVKLLVRYTSHHTVWKMDASRLTPGGSPLYGNWSTCVMSAAFSLSTYCQLVSTIWPRPVA